MIQNAHGFVFSFKGRLIIVNLRKQHLLPHINSFKLKTKTPKKKKKFQNKQATNER